MTLSRKTFFIGLLTLLVAVLASSCHRKGRPDLKPLKNRSSGAILNRYNDRLFTFDYLTMRVSVDLKTPDESQSFKANIRMAADSIIWVSISPLMGVEMVRALITPDTVTYISKVPGNKHFFRGSFTDLTSLTQSEFDFRMIEQLLVGNLLQLDEANDRFATRIDQRAYVLLSRYNRKLKRVMGTDLKEINPEDTLEIDIEDKKYQRIIKRSDEEELLMKRYWISGDSYRPVKTVFDDLYYQRYLQIEHSQHKEAQGMLYPQKTVLTTGTPQGSARFSIEVTRLKHQNDLEFPFEIPDDYERKFLP
jgi:hypothetical protein